MLLTVPECVDQPITTEDYYSEILIVLQVGPSALGVRFWDNTRNEIRPDPSTQGVISYRGR